MISQILYLKSREVVEFNINDSLLEFIQRKFPWKTEDENMFDRCCFTCCYHSGTTLRRTNDVFI